MLQKFMKLGYNKSMLRAAAGMVLLVMVYGCAGTTIRYVNPDADFSYIQKVAILPFHNLSDDRFAGERVRNALIADLIARDIFDVVERGEVSKVLSLMFRDIGVEEGQAVEVDRETLKRIGERLGVQAIILGSVDEYSGRGSSRGNVVTLSVRMLDASSGTVLWQAKATAVGSSVWRKVLGLEEVDMSTLTAIVVKNALDTLVPGP